MATDDEIQLVIERLKTNPPNVKLSIGNMGTFSRDEMIEAVQNKTELGEFIVEFHLKYLRSLKKL